MGTFRIIKTMPNQPDFSLFESVISNVYGQPNVPDFQNLAHLKNSYVLPTQHLKSCLILVSEDKTLARLAIYQNPHFEDAFLFGGYECVNDFEVSMAILEAGVEEVIRMNNLEGNSKLPSKKGLRIIGPMDGSTWENYRFVLPPDPLKGEPSFENSNLNPTHIISPLGDRGLRRPFLLEPTHPNYYINQWQLFGLQLIADYRSDFRNTLEIDFNKLRRWESYFKNKGIRVRPFDKNQAEMTFQKLAKFNMEAFKDNYLFSPISEEYFVEKYRKALPLIYPNLVHLAWEKEEIVGMVFCISNLLSPQPNETIILKTLAAKSEYRFRGLGDLLYRKSMEGGMKIGAKNVIHALMKNDNISINISKKYKAECFRKYGLFEMKI